MAKYKYKYRYKFDEPVCRFCEYHEARGSRRYCRNFRNPRIFKANDAKVRPPKWCPKRILPPVVRIFRRMDYESLSATREMRTVAASGSYPEKLSRNCYTSAPVHEYARYISARQVYERIKREDAMQLDGFDLSQWDVVEIDNGLKPHYLVYLGSQHGSKWVRCKPIRFEQGDTLK